MSKTGASDAWSRTRRRSDDALYVRSGMKPFEESANDAEQSSEACTTLPLRARRRRRSSNGESRMRGSAGIRMTPMDIQRAGQSHDAWNAVYMKEPRLLRPCLEMLCFAVAWAVVLVRLAHSMDLVRDKAVQLFLLGILVFSCFFSHLSSACTIWATRVCYMRKSDLGDPLYILLMPLVVCASLLDAMPGVEPRALAPPRISRGLKGAWRAEKLGVQNDPVLGRCSAVDLQMLCAALMGFHVLASSIARRLRKRQGRHLPIEELSGLQAFAYFHGFCVVLALLFTGVHVGLRYAGLGRFFFAAMPSWMILALSLSFQLQLYIWTRVAQQNCTIGELAILCTTTTAIFHEAWIMTMARLVPSYVTMYLREPTVLLVYQMALIVGMFLLGLVLSPLLVLSRNLARRPTHRLRWPDKRNLHRRLLAMGFFVLSLTLVLSLLGPWVSWQLGGRNPWLYVIRFTLQGPTWWSRWALVVYWGVLCNIALLSIQLMVNRVWQFATVGDQVKTQTVTRPATLASAGAPRRAPTASQRAGSMAAARFASRIEPDEGTSLGPQVAVSVNGRRKFFHALAVLLFVPGLAWDPAFMHLAFSAAMSLFILLEYLRYCAVVPVGATLHFFLSQFLDSKDTGLVILSHVYLLIGCAMAVWCEAQSRLVMQLGVIVLGVGDALASVIGRQYGRIHWPHSKKTVEGTLGFIASTVACASGMRVLRLVEAFSVRQFTIVVTLLAVVEGLSEQNDNLVLPLWGLLLSSLIPYI